MRALWSLLVRVASARARQRQGCGGIALHVRLLTAGLLDLDLDLAPAPARRSLALDLARMAYVRQPCLRAGHLPCPLAVTVRVACAGSLIACLQVCSASLSGRAQPQSPFPDSPHHSENSLRHS
ncbi:hypothetical protein C8Q72DRAFT_864719 [Fomitopsis betulina]|nr:hypothetical protein C8Q72DRAFT_864719 [Fomitopsis betulina]